MINVSDENDSSYSEEYDENDYDEISNESSEEINDLNDLKLEDSDESENSESSDVDITLKTTMIFPKKGQNVNKIQSIVPIPQLKGIVLPKQKPLIVLPKKNVRKYDAEEIELILQKMPGINVSDNPINYDRQNIYDLLEKESQESIKDFNIRKDITIKIHNIENLKIKNSTCIVLGLMIAKKLRFGIKYDDNTEILVKDILAMLS